MTLKSRRHFHNLQKISRGFTLLESLVVIAIILVLTAIVLPNYRAGEKSFLLEKARAKLSQDLWRIEEFAISAKEFQGAIPQGGYGIYARTGDGFYTLFADGDKDSQYDLSEKVEEISLGSQVLIGSVSPGSPLTVVFIPPHPLIFISGGSQEGIIVLALKTDLTKTKNVKVNKAGLIESY